MHLKDDARYCNVVSQTCGNTTEYKNAQLDDTYHWEALACPGNRPMDTIHYYYFNF